MKLLTILFSIFFVFSPQINAEKKVFINPVPQWVSRQQIPTDRDVREMDQSSGIVILLVDEQYDLASQTYFEHNAQKIVSSAGLQNTTKLTIFFDPTYQRLIIHTVHIIRDGKEISLLDQRRIKVFQQEQSLEFDLYDGRLTALVLLDDIRIGDILEYSYSIVGWNPIYNNMFIGGFQLEWNLPIGKLFCRMIVPKGRTINIAYHRRNLAPKITSGNRVVEYVWQVDNVVAIFPEERTPLWYFPFAWIQLSEFSSWHDVANWANGLFTLPADEISAVRMKIDELKKKTTSKEEYIQAALRFVQDDIRYFGIEMGSNSHRPTPPSKVFRQRFGDCKDKSLLLCALLRGAGINAEPVLVNTGQKNQIASLIPSPQAFNHVVVRLIDWNKSFDPTLTHQRGLFSLLTFPHELKGLVIDSSAETLIDLTDHSYDQSRSEVQEHFFIRDFSGPVKVKVSSTYYGNKANQMRGFFNGLTSHQMEQFGSSYYAKEYENVVTLQPLKISLDDEMTNILVLTEEYMIDSLWQRNDEQNRIEANFYATSMRERFDIPSSSQRTMPLGTNHPANLIYKIRIDLPEEWDIKNQTDSINDSSFTFSSSQYYSERRIELTYSYLSHRDFIPPELLRTYAENVTNAKNMVGYALYKYDSGSGQENETAGTIWIFPAVLWTGFIIGMYLSVRAWKWSEPKPENIEEPHLAEELHTSKMTLINNMIEEKFIGIKGWLILPAIHLVITPIIFLYKFAVLFYPIFTLLSWKRLTSSNSQFYHPAFASLLTGELVMNVAILIFTIIVALYFFRKKRQAPILMIWWYAITSTFPLIDSIVAYSFDLPNNTDIGITAQDVAQWLGAVCIWVPYFYYSERVESTFVL